MFRKCQTTLCCKKILVVLPSVCRPPLDHPWIPIPPRCPPDPCACGCPPTPCPAPCPCPPVPDARTHDFWFRKTDEGGAPLPGAVFTLSDGRGAVRLSTSDSNGLVFFGSLMPGRYTLTETAPPPGFIADNTRHVVLIGRDGTVTIGGMPFIFFVSRNIRQQQAAQPTVQDIYAGAALVLGSGTPGCTVCAQWPTGGQGQAMVDGNGSFAIQVPFGLTLSAGQSVAVWQQCQGGVPSPLVIIAVRP